MAGKTVGEELTQLESFQELVQQWHDNLVQDVPPTADGLPDAEEFYERWRQTVARWSTLINRQMPPALDPEEVAEVRGDLIEIMGSVADYAPERPLDSMDAIMVHLEAIRHVVRDAVDGHVAPETDARPMLVALEDKLPRITRKDLGQLLGTSDRSIQRTLKSPAPVPPARRLVIVARLVEILRRGWTPEGVVAWFFRPRAELDGKAPFDVLDDVDSERALLSAAKQGRAQHGA